MKPHSHAVEACRRLALLGACAGVVATAASPWDHGASPFRAEFEIGAAPTLPDAGYALSVPVCGLGFADGSDLVAFDDGGRPLPLLALGESTGNAALALVQPGPGAKRLFLYFGSKAKAPQNKMVFKPSLTVDIRTCPDGPVDNWKQVEKLVDRSERLARLPVEQISLSRNPVNSRDGFIMVFEGYLNVAKAGPQTLMLVCDDAGYVFVNGKPLLSRDGRKRYHELQRGECRAVVDLPAGPVPLKMVVADPGGEAMAVLARYVDAKTKTTLGAQDFVLPGRTKYVGVAARDKGTSCPAFRYGQVTYIGYGSIVYTEVECSTLDGEIAEWRFDDGARYQGATFKKVFVGLGDVGVRVRQGRYEAVGKIQFPDDPPAQKSIGTAAHFRDYAALILQENAERLELPTATGYRTFLMFRDLNPDLLELSLALLKRNDLPPQLRWDVLRDVGRLAGATKPDVAAGAYDKLLAGNVPGAMWAESAREYVELALLKRRDFKLAERLIRDMEEKGGNPAAEIQTLRFLETFLKGETENAQARLQRLVDKVVGKTKPAEAAVKRNAIEARFQDLLQSGFLYDARRQLREWELVAPDDWRTGRLVLARSRLWRVYGWPDAALVELDAVMKLNPLLPNLPEIELAQGEAWTEAGDTQKAAHVFRRVAEKYPNHPAATRARGFLR